MRRQTGDHRVQGVFAVNDEPRLHVREEAGHHLPRLAERGAQQDGPDDPAFPGPAASDDTDRQVHLDAVLVRAGDIDLLVDRRAQMITASITVHAPEDKGPVGRVSWLVNQLSDADGRILIEAWVKNARQPTTATLAQVREDRNVLLGDGAKAEPVRFRIVQRSEMGLARKTATKSASFIDTGA